MKKLMQVLKSIRIPVLALAAVSFAFAQNTTTSTTLSAAITANNQANPTQQQWCVASATNVTAPTISQGGSILFVQDAGGGGEFAQVTQAGYSTTCFVVKRGLFGSTASAAHASGATVYVGYASTGSGDTSRPFTGAFTTISPVGSCVRASQYTLPVIVTGALAGYRLGQQYDCINQQWTNVTPIAYESLVGATQAAAASPSAATAVLTVVGGVGGATTSTTGTGAAGGAVSLTGGLGGVGGTSSGAGGAGGAIINVGGAGAGTVTGGAGGAVTSTAGAGANGTTTGGAGGAASLIGGAAGTGPTAGVGGAAAVTAGAGGAQSATTNNGSAGGAVTVTAGVGGAGGSASGTGGTGGALTQVAGAGGGTVTGGVGGAVSVTAGAGGNGTSAGGVGGALTLASGAAGTGGTGTFGAVAIKQGATNILSATTAGATTLASATSGQAIAITPAGAGVVSITNNSNALTLPSNVAGGIPLMIGCGATSTGTANCGNTATGGTAHIFSGQATLSSNAQVITFGTAFTSTATYSCVANDITTRANVVQMVQTTSATATITNTTGGSDSISWICAGY